MGITPPGAESTYGKRLRQYQRRERTILWVAAGLAALIGLVTSDLTKGAPRALTAAAASLIMLGGAALALARIRFEWAGTQLDRTIQDAEAAVGDQLPADRAKWPKLAEVSYLAGIALVPSAALVYASAIWYAAR